MATARSATRSTAWATRSFFTRPSTPTGSTPTEGTHRGHRMEMKTAISGTRLRHRKRLMAVGVGIGSRAALGSKNHAPKIAKIDTQSNGIIIKRLEAVDSQRESVKNDKPTI